jgi:hypothetical protein
MSALPPEYKQIDIYAENPALTAILFRSKRKTLLFTLKSGQVWVVIRQKGVSGVNCITYEENNGHPQFVLWFNGQRELSVGAEPSGDGYKPLGEERDPFRRKESPP